MLTLAALVAGFAIKANAQETTSPTIQSDQADYPPGGTVVLTGSGWQPDESVNISVNDDAGKTWSRNVDVTADESGQIRDEFQLPDWFVAQYSVKATGSSGTVATTSFTDGNVNVNVNGIDSASISWKKYAGSSTCSGSSTGGTVTAPSSGNAQVTDAVSTDRVQLSAPSSVAGKVFSSWKSGGTTLSTETICFAGSNGNQTWTANYVTPAVTTTSVGNITASASTYGGTTNLSATVSPSGAPGSVAFYVNGSATPAAGTVTYSSSTGVATLSNYAHGLNASTTPYSVKAVFTSSSSSYSNSETTNNSALTVNKKAITITPDSGQSKVYGSSDPTALSFTHSPALQSGDSFSGKLGRASGENVGNYAINLGNLSAGTNYNLSLPATPVNFAITPKSVTGSFTVANKTYDGNTSATITDRSLSGKVDTDNVNLTDGTATFTDKNAGTGKTINGTGFTLSGTAASNYTLASSNLTTTADISKKSLTGNFTAQNKVYDGNRDATISGGSLDGVVGTEDVGLDRSSASALFDTKDVGTGKTVTGSGFSLSGDARNNYTLGSVSDTTADITRKSVTGNFTAKDKVYDRTTSAEVLNKSLASGDVIGDDTVNLDVSDAQFGDKNVANGKTVSATLALSGGQADNYILTSTTANTTADITAKSITGSFTSANKVYDGNTDAAASNRSLTGVIDHDAVSLTGGAAAFNDKNVGSNKPVTLSGATLDGADAANYDLSSVDNAHADITQRPITVSADAKSKIYGEEDPPLTYETDVPLLGEDNFSGSLIRDSGENVGSYPIRQGSLSAGGNYSLTYNGANLTIEKAAATISLNQDDLEQNYNGSPKEVRYSTSPQSLSDDVSVTYNGNDTKPTNAGSYDVVATLNNANYQAENATGTLVIQRATPQITWSNPAPIEYGTLLSDTQLNAAASGVGGGSLPGNFVYSPPSGTELNAGTHQLTADFTPDDTGNYNGNSKKVEIVVEKAGQTIDFGALSAKTFGDPDFTLNASASSGLGVGFEASGNCSVNDDTVTITGAGSCTITASQAGNGNYEAATPVARQFNIGKATATLSLNQDDLNQLYNGSPKEVRVNTTPDVPDRQITVRYYSDAQHQNQVQDPTNAGTYYVVASLNEHANYQAENVAGTLVIHRASLTVTADTQSKVYGQPDPPLTYKVTAALWPQAMALPVASARRGPECRHIRHQQGHADGRWQRRCQLRPHLHR